MLALAGELRSFSPVMFGVPDEEENEEAEEGEGGFSVSPEDARLAAGALVWATDVLMDQLFQDVQTLTEEETTAAECDGHLWHLEDLPARYALQYDRDMDHEWLYDDSMDGMDESPIGEVLRVAPMGFKAWFSPFNRGRYVHPYAADEPEAAAS